MKTLGTNLAQVCSQAIIAWRTCASFEMVQQSLIKHNGRYIDKVQIKTTSFTSTEVITQLESFYFDITDCYGKIGRSKDDVWSKLFPEE